MIATVFDWETTGLPLHPQAPMKLQPRCIEFGAVWIDETGAELHRFNFLIDPEQTIEPVITKITGITNEDLAGQPTFRERLPEVREAFAGCDVMIAHNLPFDEFLLELELARLGVTDFEWPRHKLCTAQTYQERWGRRPKLLELYERVMGRPLAQTHRADDDCAALAEIVVAENLLELFR
jgi:DNA polymerase-3 subunit epsilon